MSTPTITTKTYRERSVFLRWKLEDAPFVEVPHSDQMAVLTYLHVSQEEGREPRVAHATGVYAKKDGTPGARPANIYIGNLSRLPECAKIAALDALKGVSW